MLAEYLQDYGVTIAAFIDNNLKVESKIGIPVVKFDEVPNFSKIIISNIKASNIKSISSQIKVSGKQIDYISVDDYDFDESIVDYNGLYEEM